MTYPGRIDVHHHLSTPAFRRHLDTSGFVSTRSNKIVWTPEGALDSMDARRTATAILSLGRPGVHLGDADQARKAARECNEEAAEIVRRWPRRFGAFAVLTLPDVKGSIAEAQYALRYLGADGIVLLSNAHGIYLGDPRFDPLMEALHDHDAVVFVHPTHVPGRDLLQPALALPGVPVYVVDFLIETVRVAINLLLHDVPRRYPEIRFILPHGGAFLPYAADRIAYMLPELEGSPLADPEEVIEAARDFYFDLTQATRSFTLRSLLEFAHPDRLLFGSDYPAISDRTIRHCVEQLDSSPLIDDDMRDKIDYSNALELFPRLAAASPA